MNSRERVVKVLNKEEIDRFPRNLWHLPYVSMFCEDELSEVREMYPTDFTGPVFEYGKDERAMGDPNKVGWYRDSWGCVWHVAEVGVVGEVKEHPLENWDQLLNYKLPWKMLEDADFSKVNESCAKTDKFILAGTEVRPFERMQFLRGTENLFMDLAYGVKEVYKLRDMLHEFNMREMEMWAATDVNGVSFMDDWGSQKALLISPKMWREFFKPLYKDYCNILHSKNKFVFFHSDGFIEDIYPDLIEIGIDAINSQLFCMNMEKLGELYAGKITFWGEIDRQYVLPFGSEEEVRNAVRRVAKALIKGKRTGIIAQCEWGKNVRKENIIAVFDEWEKY
jgi:hypothetical protein